MPTTRKVFWIGLPRRAAGANDASGGAQAGRDAVGYARALGFSPGLDYKKASRVFGGITTADCDEEFVFGKDGKPFYIQGPSDSSTRAERILRALEARCGEGGYHYIVAADDFEPLDGEEEAANAPSPVPSVEQAWRRWPPGCKPASPAWRFGSIRGRRKVSDMISLVAEPLLESAPDFKSKEMILNLAALAWNFTLLDPAAQGEMLANIAELFQYPEGWRRSFTLRTVRRFSSLKKTASSARSKRNPHFTAVSRCELRRRCEGSHNPHSAAILASVGCHFIFSCEEGREFLARTV